MFLENGWGHLENMSAVCFEIESFDAATQPSRTTGAAEGSELSCLAKSFGSRILTLNDVRAVEVTGSSFMETVARESALLAGDWESLHERPDGLTARHLARTLWISALGAGLFGASMGWWRSPWMAAINAVKFPLIILATAFGNALLNGLLAALLGARLKFRESLMLVLLSFEVAAMILASMAPINLFLVWNLPPMSDSQETQLVYSIMKLIQVVVIAAAGLIACWRLLSCLAWRLKNRRAALKVFWAWIAGNLLLGTQLTWICRPFVGSPHLPVSFFRSNAFQSNFFESAWESFGQVFFP